MNEWIARVLPLRVAEPNAVYPSVQLEIARFRIRLVPPAQRPRGSTASRRWDVVDVGPVRILALDSANPHGGVGGSLDSDQAAWLVRQLDVARDRYVVVATYDSSLTLTSERSPAGSPPRLLGPEVSSILLAHDRVIAWVSGTMHHRSGRRHGEASHGFWELPGSTEGRDAPLAGGLSISRLVDRQALVLRGALMSRSAPIWQLRDPLPDAGSVPDPSGHPSAEVEATGDLTPGGRTVPAAAPR